MSDIRVELLKIIEHSTLEEHTAVELIMTEIETYTTQQVAKADREARIDELNRYKNLYIDGDDDRIDSRIAELKSQEKE